MREIKYFGLAFFLLFLAQATDSCSSSSAYILIKNTTRVAVRVFVVLPGGGHTLASPTPGESETVDVAKSGTFTASVIPDASWTDYAKTARKVLTETLSNPQNLTPEKVADLQAQLKKLNETEQQFAQAAGSSGACSGKVDGEQNVNGKATISQDSSGKLTISCD